MCGLPSLGAPGNSKSLDIVNVNVNIQCQVQPSQPRNNTRVMTLGMACLFHDYVQDFSPLSSNSSLVPLVDDFAPFIEIFVTEICVLLSSLGLIQLSSYDHAPSVSVTSPIANTPLVITIALNVAFLALLK